SELSREPSPSSCRARFLQKMSLRSKDPGSLASSASASSMAGGTGEKETTTGTTKS
ncbi:unnamed protein product, partial [Amoebophrya sp. A25]